MQMQTQTLPIPSTLPTAVPRKRNLQDFLLSKLRRSRMGCTVFLVNGFQLRGEIRGFDAFVVVIYSEGRQQMVYKHAISTIVPERPLSMEEEE